MGKTFTGGSQHVGNLQMQTPEQQQFLSAVLGGIGPQAAQSYQQFLQPYQPEQFEGLFQQAFIDPAMLTYEQQVLPAIQQRFENLGAGSSSALNQALAQSATDLSTMLGSQMGQFYQQQQANQLGALGQLGGLTGQRTFDPMIQQRQGLLGPLLGAAGQIGGAYMMSSEHVKENVKSYTHGLDYVKDLEVKQYDYKPGYQPHNRDRVGFIAEDVPEELQLKEQDILGVDLYGLLAVAINAIKQLTTRVEELEAK